MRRRGFSELFLPQQQLRRTFAQPGFLFRRQSRDAVHRRRHIQRRHVEGVIRADDHMVSADLVERDGTHPSDSGRRKVADMLMNFFRTDPFAKGWYLNEK